MMLRRIYLVYHSVVVTQRSLFQILTATPVVGVSEKDLSKQLIGLRVQNDQNIVSQFNVLHPDSFINVS